ncbi:MAG: hypothetical protein SGPRY_012789 [Prymnesium sp.]
MVGKYTEGFPAQISPASWLWEVREENFARLAGFIDAHVGSSCELRLRFDVKERSTINAGAFHDDSLRFSSHSMPSGMEGAEPHIAGEQKESTWLTTSPPSRREMSSEMGYVTKGNTTCADPHAPFSSLPSDSASLVDLSGIECSAVMLFSSIWFSTFLSGGVRAACEATAEEWKAAATTFENSTLPEQPAWSLPLSPRVSMATLCPATCATVGVFSDSCPVPPLPTPPSTPPVMVEADSNMKANTTDQLRAAVSAARLNASVTVELATGCVFLLEGRPLSIEQGNVTIRGEGEGAHIDAQQLSRIFEVRAKARLRVERVTLSNGWTTLSGGAIASSGGAVGLVGCAVLNSSSYAGGAISMLHGQLHIIGCEVFSSHAELGGAIFVSMKSSAVLRKSFFINCTATHVHELSYPACVSECRLMRVSFVVYAGWVDRTCGGCGREQ